MILPITLFHSMNEGIPCDGSWETGSVVVVKHDNKTRYIRSIAELTDASGNIIGWVYLADDYKADRAEYVQATKAMSGADLRALNLRLLQSGDTPVTLLRNPLPKSITVHPCSVPSGMSTPGRNTLKMQS